nr:hypothetical protein CFP56_18611 [Quercus suber]
MPPKSKNQRTSHTIAQSQGAVADDSSLKEVHLDEEVEQAPLQMKELFEMMRGMQRNQDSLAQAIQHIEESNKARGAHARKSERSKIGKRNAPQALLVVANEPASKKKNEKGKAIEEYPPISCTSEELSVILNRWIADGVVKLYKIDRKPTKEDKKHSCFYRYHRYVHHPTVECHYIQRLFREKLADNTLEIGCDTQGVQRNPLPQHDRGKGIVAMVIHASGEEEEEDPMISATLTLTAIKTLQRSFAFRSLFNQLGFTPKARMTTIEAIVGIASSSRSHCFTAKAHASRAFLETTNVVIFTDENMEV